MAFKKSFFQNVLRAEMEKVVYKTNKEVDDTVQVSYFVHVLLYLQWLITRLTGNEVILVVLRRPADLLSESAVWHFHIIILLYSVFDNFTVSCV